MEETADETATKEYWYLCDPDTGGIIGGPGDLHEMDYSKATKRNNWLESQNCRYRWEKYSRE